MKKFMLLTLLALFSWAGANAQVNSMAFNQSAGTYTPVTGGTVHGDDSNDDDDFESLSIGFTFTYAGVAYTSYSVNSNGWIGLGGGVRDGSTTVLTVQNNAIAAFARDLEGISGAAELMSKLEGASGSQVLTIQWKNYKRYYTTGTGDTLNFQIKLYEGSNKIEIIYGNCVAGSSITDNTDVGLRGATESDFSVRSVISGTNTWETSVAGALISANCGYGPALKPTNGLKYSWTNVTQEYLASTTNAVVGNAQIGTANQAVIQVKVDMLGIVNPLNITSMTLNTNGTTDLTNISSAKLYYTAGSNSFATTTMFGSAIANPNGTLTFTGNIPMAGGPNYFWLAYDVNPTATAGNAIDGECTSMTIGGVVRTPAVTAPEGKRYLQNLYFAEGFNSTTLPTGWTTSLASSYWSCVSSGSYSSTSPFSGSGLLEFDADGASAGTIEYAITPAINLTSRGTAAVDVEFWVHRVDRSYSAPSRIGSLIEVYVDTVATAGTGTLLSLNNTSLNSIYSYYTSAPAVTAVGWYKYSFSIPAAYNTATNYIKIKATSDYYNNVHIDDFAVSSPMPMLITDVAADQPATYVAVKNTTNQVILRANVKTMGAATPKTITSMWFNTAGSSSASTDLTNARVLFSGSSEEITSATQFGSDVASPNGAFNVTGSQALIEGDNYFWLVYDIAAGAGDNNLIDAKIDSLFAGTTKIIPSVTDPVGNRKIVSRMAGPYTVGTSGTYPTLAAAANDLNLRGMQGNVQFDIISDITETEIIGILPWDEAGTGDYTLTVAPSGAARTITGSQANGLVFLADADRVTFDGRIGGTGNNLTFINNGAGPVFVVASYQADNDGANNNTIRNLNITGSDNANSSVYGIWSTYGATATESNNNNNSIIENNFSKLYQAIRINGGSNQYDNNWLIENNTIGNANSALTVGHTGIYAANTVDMTIRKNHVFNITSTIYGSYAGINLASGANNNAVVENNLIHNIKQPHTSGYGAYGINVDGTPTNVTIKNNMISDISTLQYGATSPSYTYGSVGIRIVAGTNHKVNHNTVNLTGTTPNIGTSACKSIAFVVGSTSVTGLDVRNNIFVNTMNHNVTGSKSYVITIPSSYTGFANLENNLYFTTGAYGKIAAIGSTDYTSFSDWHTAMPTYDLASLSMPVTFTDTTLMHLNGDNIKIPLFIAPVLSAVATDYDGETRTATNNYIGADIVVPTTMTSTLLPAESFKCGGASITYTFTPTATAFADNIARTISAGDIPSINYTWMKDESEVDSENSDFVINRNTLTINNIQNSYFGAYHCEFAASETSNTTNIANLGVEEPVVIDNKTNSYNGCMHDASFTMSVTASGTITGYKWFKQDGEGWIEFPAETTAVFVKNITTYEETVGTYKCEVLGPGNCGPDREIATFNITMDLPITNVDFSVSGPEGEELAQMYLCENAEIRMTATPTGTVTGYKWQKQRNDVWIDLPLVEYPTADKATFIIPVTNQDHSGKYRVIVYGSEACATNFIAETEIRVFPEFKFKQEPQSQTLCEGSTVALGVVGDGEIVSYQWLFDGKEIDTVANPTALTPFLEIPNANYQMSGNYSVRILTRDCRGYNFMTSDAAQVYIMRATEITSEPVSTYAKLGDKVVYTVGAHHKGKVPPTYKDKFQWFRYTLHTNTVTMLTDNARFNGTNSSEMSISNVKAEDYTSNGDYFFVVVEGMCGNDTSKAVTLDLPPVVTIDIKSQPADMTVCEDASAEFDVVAETASGKTLTYQWYFNGGKINDGADVTGATTSKLQLSNVNTNNAGIYTVTVDIVGGGSAINSQAADLVINTKPTLTTDLADMTVLTGKELKLTVVAEGTAPMTYVWTKDGLTIKTSATNELVIAAAADTDAGTYQVTITNDCGEVKSKAAVVTVTKKVVLGVEESSISDAYIAPNPAQENAVITFNSNASGMATIAIMDVLGNEVARVYEGTIEAGMNRASFNIAQSNLASGTYYAVISTANGKQAVQFVVVR